MVTRTLEAMAQGGIHDHVGGGDGFAGGNFAAKGADVRYTLQVDFTEAAKGARKRVTLPGGNALDLNVPAGVDDGRVLRLKGKGQPGVNGGPSGDALVEITVRPHRHFERDGKNIRLELPISIDEAVLGGKVAVDTIWGAVNLTIPKGTSSGQTFRLRGKGISHLNRPGNGDQLVRVIAWTPQDLNSGQKKRLAALRDELAEQVPQPGRTLFD